jgi:hypothetical protein
MKAHALNKDKDYMSNKFVVDFSSFYLRRYSHTRVQTHSYKCSSVYFILTTRTPFCPINTYDRLFYKGSLIYISQLHPRRCNSTKITTSLRQQNKKDLVSIIPLHTTTHNIVFILSTNMAKLGSWWRLPKSNASKKDMRHRWRSDHSA